jgi:hypothetical protein
MEMTTIQITKEDEERLRALKIHPSQPIREVIETILDKEEREELIDTIIEKHTELCTKLSDSYRTKKVK